MRTITIQLPNDLDQQLRDRSERLQQAPEQVVGDILRRRLRVDRFHDLCRQSEALAQAAGFQSEDDVLRAIS